MGGWIKIHRKLTDNPMWTEEPFTKGQAWIDLLLMADYSTGNVDVSIYALAKRWKWYLNKAKRYLKELADCGMIELSPNLSPIVSQDCHQSCHHLLHIIKWKEYQSIKDDCHQSRHDFVTNNVTNDVTNGANLPLYSNKEIYKKGEEERSARTREAAPAGAVRPSFEEVRDYCAAEGIAIDARAFFDHYEAVGWKAGAALITDWKAKVRDWARTDRERWNQPVGGNLRPLQQSKSFDGKEFFEAALAKNYGTLGGTNGPMDNCG